MTQEAQTASNETPRFYILRHDTLLGPCQALSDELGFNPTLLRVALCALLFWNPAAVIGGYIGAAGFVAVIDWLFPRHRSATAAPVIAEAGANAPAETAAVEAEAEREHEPELIAA